jgi:hypothetical protein
MYRFRTEEADTQKMLAGPIGHRTPSKAAACWQSKFSEPTPPTSEQADAARIHGIGRRWRLWSEFRSCAHRRRQDDREAVKFRHSCHRDYILFFLTAAYN